jgi:DNA-binding Lrp family transcriptional regulator
MWVIVSRKIRLIHYNPKRIWTMATTDSTTRNLRRRNRSAVLRELLRNGETTRGQLASALRLSPATVTNVVTDLMVEGLAHETGSLPSEGGRPTATLSIRPEGAHFIGADVGEHGVTVEVLDLSLSPKSKVFRDVPSRSAGPHELSEALYAAIDEAITAAGAPENIYGVGLGMPGIVESAAASPFTRKASTGPQRVSTRSTVGLTSRYSPTTARKPSPWQRPGSVLREMWMTE